MSNIRLGETKFLVTMDKPGTKGPPGHFYVKLDELGPLRIQRSVYLVADVQTAKDVSRLGKCYGFFTRIFQVVGEIVDEYSSF